MQIATVVKEALANVVMDGTARRLRGSFPLQDGSFLPIGGKTGTGDHRFEVYAPNGTVLESKVMNRTATFAFYLGSRFFGVMTVFVPGEAAADYHFTSGLAVQIVKDMEPALRSLVLGSETPEPAWDELLKDFEADTTREGVTPQATPLPPPGAQMEATAVPPEKPAIKSDTAKPNAAKPSVSKQPHTAPGTEKPAAMAPPKQEVAPAPEPLPAPPPPQVDKPDPLPPPQAPKPATSREKPTGPWVPPTGSGFLFF